MSIAKLTNSTDEAPISDLFSGDSVFGIPYFQRAYKWGKSKIQRFIEDLSNLVEFENTSHFLGAIIVFAKSNNPSDPRHYEVIDGQQRLTTCFISLVALCKTFALHGFYEDALGLYQKYLIILRRTNQITNARLICCKEDRAGFNAIFQDLNSVSAFLQILQRADCTYRVMPNAGTSKGKVLDNYKEFCKFYDNKFKEAERIVPGDGREALTTLYSKLVDYMSVVQIVVKDPTDGPKIFNSLNSKQEPITIGDLVRNELFSRFAGSGDDEIKMLDSEYWHPFYDKFRQTEDDSCDRVFEQYFFPFVLTKDHTVKKQEAFNYLRNHWAAEQNPITIIHDLERHQDVYLDLCYGTSFNSCPPEIKKMINRFFRMGAPTSIYPFIMKVTDAVNQQILDPTEVYNILLRIESFLARRVTCGFEPTGLHAVFKQLWNDCISSPSGVVDVSNVEFMIRRHTTVPWPNSEDFKKAIKTRSLYKVRITPYLLQEWDNHLPGDSPIINSIQIEHVLPETPDPDSQWYRDWSVEDHKKYKDCLANLLPLSQPLNGSIQNADYADKSVRYRNESALKAPRHFADQYQKWTMAEFIKRSEALADWAVERWPY